MQMGERKPATLTVTQKQPKVLRSDDLFDSANEVIINHQGQEYRLRITSLGKLILTK